MVTNAKKRLVVSFNNLPAELQEAIKVAYPAGFADVMIRVPKPNGEFFFAVPFETEEISYLVKIDVKIDDTNPDDDDKDIFGDEEDIGGTEELSGSDAVDEISDGSTDFDM